jgi:hypothetical protein
LEVDSPGPSLLAPKQLELTRFEQFLRQPADLRDVAAVEVLPEPREVESLLKGSGALQRYSW